MSIERYVRIIAGFFILFSLALGVPGSPLFASQGFLWFTTFVGAMLFQSGFTRICPVEWILKALGVKPAAQLPAAK
jgi:hypothetical protein